MVIRLSGSVGISDYSASRQLDARAKLQHKPEENPRKPEDIHVICGSGDSAISKLDKSKALQHKGAVRGHRHTAWNRSVLHAPQDPLRNGDIRTALHRRDRDLDLPSPKVDMLHIAAHAVPTHKALTVGHVVIDHVRGRDLVKRSGFAGFPNSHELANPLLGVGSHSTITKHDRKGRDCKRCSHRITS